MLNQLLVDKARKAFGEFDKDKSGSIDIRELRDALKPLGITMSDSEIAAFMEKWDTSGDGTIEFMEFLAIVEKTSSSGSEQNEEADMKDAWAALGGKEDSTGVIDVEEIRKTFRNFELEIDVDQLLIEIKLAGTSHIDFEAFTMLLKTSK